MQTFNFLNSEQRAVACAVIPPSYESIIEPESPSQTALDSSERNKLTEESRRNILQSAREVQVVSPKARRLQKPNSKTVDVGIEHKDDVK